MLGSSLHDDVKEKREKMNMRKTLPLLVIASMMLSLIPSMMVSAALTNNLSASTGPVGTKITVSGTLNTFNGRLIVQIDADDSGVFGNMPAEDLAGFATTLRAVGYAYSVDVTIPDAYAGARKIRVTDLDAAGAPTVDAFFTVTTSYSLANSADSIVEGGAITVTATIKGGVGPNPGPTWHGALDLQLRIQNPSGTVVITMPAAINNAGTVPGTFTQAFVIVAGNVNLKDDGVYTSYLDWDLAAVYANNAGVATKTFTVQATDKSTYQRTQPVAFSAYVPAGTTTSKWEIVDSTGAVVATAAAVVVGPNFLVAAPAIAATAKNAALGTWTLKVYDNAGTPVVFKSAPFTMAKAALVVTIIAADYDHGGNLINTADEAVERFETVNAKWTITYPSGAVLTNIDLPSGFAFKVFYNTTEVYTAVMDPITSYNVGTQKWSSSWKIPKDAKLGQKYQFNVTAAAVVDAYGNDGPTTSYGTGGVGPTINWFTVTIATITMSAPPTLLYPGVGASLQRTLEARASFDAKYSDGSKVAAADIQWVNATVRSPGLAKDYTLTLTAADYNAEVGLWIAKWNIPFDAPLTNDWIFKVYANDIVDLFGNKGPVADQNGASAFDTDPATIAVSEFAVDKTTIQTDEQLTVSFKAAYPSGATVTSRNDAGLINEYPVVEIINSNGAVVTTLRASYSSATGKWSVTWIVPTGTASGTYNATIKAYVAPGGTEEGIRDSADNTGPTAKKYTNFDVTRVTLTEILAASNAAEAEAVLAQTKADAAKTAADTAATKADNAAAAATAAQTAATNAGTAATAAGTAANAAKTAADGAAAAATAAGTKADAAVAAANAAKTAADSAASAANGLTTLVYAAIGASLVAALAAIVALMQISRKIA